MSVGRRPKTAQPDIGEFLLLEGLIDETQLAIALAEQRQWGNRVGIELVRLGYLSEEDLIRTLGRQLGLPIVRLAGKRVSSEILDLVPQSLAEKHRCIPLFVRDEGKQRVLQLAVEDPADVALLDDLQFALDMDFTPVLVTPTDLDDALQRHYRGGTEQAGVEPIDDAVFSSRASQEPLSKKPEPTGDASSSRVPAVPPAVMLRVLAQLLVEKGVIDREELVERIDQLTAESKGQ